MHALLDLALEKRYQAITVQDLLDRADVGRSTFYAHYRGKDDLLLTSFTTMLERLDNAIDADAVASGRIAPVMELFHHVGSVRQFHRSLARARKLEVLYQAGVTQLSRTIARRIAALPATSAGRSSPSAVVTHALAGALFALLRWWVDQEAPYSPERMDELYHAIVMPGVLQIGLDDAPSTADHLQLKRS